MKRSDLNITIVLVAGILVLINILSKDYFLRIDLTDDGRYTLSKVSQDILRDLKEPVTVKAYISPNLPPQIDRGARDLQEMLVEYNLISDGKLVYEIMRPEDEADQRDAVQDGIQPFNIRIRSKNQQKEQIAFLGASIQMGESKEVLPVVQPGDALEYQLTTTIKKLSVIDKPSIGLVQGHGEAKPQQLVQANQALQVLYNLEPFPLTDTTSIPERFNTLAIISPKDTISPRQLQQLDEFLNRGGNLYIAMNRVVGDFRSKNITPLYTGLSLWLETKGVQVNPNILVDAQCGAVSVPVPVQGGLFTVVQQVEMPYLPIVQNFPEHPVTEGLEAVIFPFASTMRYVGSDRLSFTPLVLSSDQADTLETPMVIDLSRTKEQFSFPLANQVMGGLLSGKINGQAEAKIVVIANGDFAVNQQPEQQLNPDNINLLVNGLDWLTDNSGLVELRTKGVRYRPLDPMEEGSQNLIRYTNFLLPILLVLAYGFMHFRRRASLRKKRQEERYV